MIPTRVWPSRFVLFALAALGWWLAVSPSTATAGIIIRKAEVVEIDDPTYRYDFQIELNAGTLTNGATFILYDLFNEAPPDNAEISLDHPAAAPPGWNVGSTLFGPTFPTPPGITDSLVLTNIYWLYNGPTLSAVTLFDFSITIVRDTYITSDPIIQWSATPGQGGTAGLSSGSVTVTRVIPEPSSLVLVGIAGLSLGLARLRRRSPAAA